MKAAKFWFLLLSIVTFLASTLQAGQAPTSAAESAKLSGRVLDSATGRPVRRAQVRLSGQGRVVLTATDADGRYEISDIPPGQFSVRASKTGYVALLYGQRSPRESERRIDLRSREVLDQVDFQLPRGATIAVSVRDDLGEPMAGVRINLERSVYTGVRRTRVSAAADGALAQTNDRGTATFSGVPPGTYYIVAIPNPVLLIGANDSGRLLAVTHYPGVTEATQAQAIAVNVDGQLEFALQLQTARTAKIQGIGRNSQGQPLTGSIGATLQLNGSGGIRNVPLASDGSFVIDNLLPGSYFLNASSTNTGTGSTRETGYLTVPVVSGQELSGVVFQTRAGSRVTGRIVFENSGPPAGVQPGVASLSTFAVGETISVGVAAVRDDWSFEMTGVAGRALLRPVTQSGTVVSTAGIEGWILKSILYQGRDVTDVPFEFGTQLEFRDLEVVLTRSHASLRGIAVDAKQVPVSDYVAVVFPPDPALWTVRSRFIVARRSDRMGQFVVAGLPPGDYLTVAVPSLEANSETDPEQLKRWLSVASKVRLTDGETRELRLMVTP